MNWLLLTDTTQAGVMAQFNTLNQLMNKKLGYPTADGKTLTYAQPILSNPSVGVYHCAFPILTMAKPFLTATQATALILPATMISQGWFVGPKGSQSIATTTKATPMMMMAAEMVQRGPLMTKQLPSPSFWARNKWKLISGALVAATTAAALTHFTFHLW